jgi:integrase
LEWAAAAPTIRQCHDRLLVVRRLACALNAEDNRHQVPPDDAFGREVTSRRKCHIFTESELQHLFQTAAQLSARRSIQAFTFVTSLSLISATGLRVSEALRLQVSDITEDGLLIRATKR